jgi:hypothetical protein
MPRSPFSDAAAELQPGLTALQHLAGRVIPARGNTWSIGSGWTEHLLVVGERTLDLAKVQSGCSGGAVGRELYLVAPRSWRFVR